MVDVTIIGTGPRVDDCVGVLSRAGFYLRYADTIEPDNASPIILGELPGAFQLAREAVSAGRHILITNARVLRVERFSQLLEQRRPAQALFAWNERRVHPGYKLLTGLIETDATWHPRYLRHEMLNMEPATSPALRWRALESLLVLEPLIRQTPRRVTATTVLNPKRNAPDLLSFSVSYRDVESYLVIGMGEPVERHETLVAADTRKAFIDELSHGTPIRIIDEDTTNSHGSRWVSYATPTSDELARLQCTAFLEATLHAGRARDDAGSWLTALSILAAVEESIAKGAPEDVVLTPEPPLLRPLPEFQEPPPSVA